MRDIHQLHNRGWVEGFRDGLNQAIMELEERDVAEALQMLRKYREVFERKLKQEAAPCETASVGTD